MIRDRLLKWAEFLDKKLGEQGKIEKRYQRIRRRVWCSC